MRWMTCHFICDASGANLRQIPNGVPDERRPRWSPSGAWLVITGATGAHSAPNTDLWVARIDGPRRQRVTQEDTRQEYASWRPASPK